MDGSTSAARAQKQKGKKIEIEVTVSCTEDVTADAGGKVKAGRSYDLAPLTEAFQAGESRTLTLKPEKTKDARAIRKAIKNGKAAKAAVDVKLTDGAANDVTDSVSVKLK